MESFPTDIEAWSELSDLYFSQNLFPQAIFCLEEVLLISPNAWNVRIAATGVAVVVASVEARLTRSLPDTRAFG